MAEYMTFEEYLESFKCMLVKRYNWSVTNAYKYKSDILNKYYNNNMHFLDAYFKIFNIEPV